MELKPVPVLTALVDFSRLRSPVFDAHYVGNEQTPTTLVDDTRAHIATERNMTFPVACRCYSKAIAWSMLVSFTIIVEAYDKSLIGSFYTSPEFRGRFRSALTEEPNASAALNPQVPAAWQTALTNAAVGAEIIGLLLNGLLMDRYRYKMTMKITLAVMIVVIPISVYATNIEWLLVFQVLCGASLGAPWLSSSTDPSQVSRGASSRHCQLRTPPRSSRPLYDLSCLPASTCAGFLAS